MSVSTPELPAAIGVDLGGTKIEATLFGSDMTARDTRRRPTPRESYADLLGALEDEVSRLRHKSGVTDLPVGIGLPGLVDAQSGVSVCANLVADGHALARDLTARIGGRVVVANDCKCFALSEACGGAGAGRARVFGLILGTGLGGGLCQDGKLVLGLNGLPGEIGHVALPAHLVARHDLPLVVCGCGRTGCMETLVSGTGMARLAKALTGRERGGPEIAAAPDEPENARILHVWSALAAELLHSLQLHIDPDCIVLGGGLSNIAGLESRLADALKAAALPSVRLPEIVKPAFGDSSGGRGAALLSLQPNERDMP
ncbi:ROK family protein [Limimaricola litoreus]|uniref:ROK family protein n=1 Tax=Limimaricola litoreus TaxID=2955316 RepID=A0A9X2JQJ5_9RHOB|nr:ROK family protein [Limimaricola litoreus]MCP1170638.1 ROK family protein [Limimaricola litoreus]